MKAIIVAFAAIIACSLAVPREILMKPALEYSESRDPKNQFKIHFMTEHGTIHDEEGYLVPNKDGTDYVMEIRGKITFIGEDGVTYTTSYSSGRDGFKAEGAHLVKPEV